MILPQDKEDHPFIIHRLEDKEQITYQMGIQFDEELKWFEFPLPPQVKGPMLVDQPNITRLFSDLNHENRSIALLKSKGGSEQAYTEFIPYRKRYSLFTAGNVRINKSEALFSEIYFDSPRLTGRWILRVIPNVFNKGLFSGKDVVLLWKPKHQKSFNQCFNDQIAFEAIQCDCPNEVAKSLNSDKANLIDVPAKFESHIDVDTETHTLTGIAAAEGTWIDLFGNKFTYTPKFMDTLFKRIKEKLPFVTIDKDHDGHDKGLVESVDMVQEPIKHIIAKGRYNGSIDEVRGFSLEMMLRSVWSNDFQSWIPFDANPERLSLVGSPACKICWINQVN